MILNQEKTESKVLGDTKYVRKRVKNTQNAKTWKCMLSRGASYVLCTIVARITRIVMLNKWLSFYRTYYYTILKNALRE